MVACDHQAFEMWLSDLGTGLEISTLIHYILIFFCSAKDPTQAPVHTSQALSTELYPQIHI